VPVTVHTTVYVRGLCTRHDNNALNASAYKHGLSTSLVALILAFDNVNSLSSSLQCHAVCRRDRTSLERGNRTTLRHSLILLRRRAGCRSRPQRVD
jgi:hypothetical protein